MGTDSESKGEGGDGDGILATMNSIHLVVDDSVFIGRSGDAVLRPTPSNKSVARPFAVFDEDKKIVLRLASPAGEMSAAEE